MNETHCIYGYYQDTSEYVKKIGGHHASFNATPPILGKFAKKHHFRTICSLSDTLNLNPHE